MNVVVTILSAQVKQKNRVEIRCEEGCGHRVCADCHGGHYQMRVGVDGLCWGCREARLGRRGDIEFRGWEALRDAVHLPA